ncbi:MAG: FAD-dependent monooxygenase, partial [Pseudomonadota bacterium]
IIEKNNLEQIAKAKTIHDGRVSAIASRSKEILTDIDIWSKLSEHAGPINDIRVLENNSTNFLHFCLDIDNLTNESDNAHNISSQSKKLKLSEDNSDSNKAMGYIIPNHDIYKTVIKQAQENQFINIIDNNASFAIKNHNSYVEIILADNRKIAAALLIGADGKNSITRRELGIKTTIKDYNQTAIICNILHEFQHEGVAVEHFMPNGPFAILPMRDQNQSSIVWTEASHLADIYLKMPKNDLQLFMEKKFGDFLGELQINSKIYSYKLQMVRVNKFYEKRAVIIGDAAHAIHPIAGQGLNLALRDVDILAKILAEQNEAGLDLGSENILKKYNIKRQYDVRMMQFMTDFLNNLFVSKNNLLRFSRDYGLGAVNKIPVIKKFLMNKAMGY